MKRTSMHSLEPSSAPKKIAAAKSNKLFMATLLDRDHRGHRDAVDQWTRLHEAAFPKSGPLGPAHSHERPAEEPAGGRELVRKHSKWPEGAGHRSQTGGTTGPFKSRMQGTVGTDREAPSEARPAEPPIVNLAADRIQAILDDTPALFEIAVNPDADKHYADSYADHDAGAIAVLTHRTTLEREAARQGVDPDLVKAIMYVENAQGQLYAVAETIGLASTILPMNINKNLWSGLGAEPDEFSDPAINIRMGVTLIRRIRDRIDGPTPATIASIWNFAGHEVVSDFGARVQDVRERRLWLEPLRYDLQGGMPDMYFGAP